MARRQNRLKVKELLEIAIKASIKAGEEIMKVYGSTEMGVSVKSDDSPLTLADQRANSVIMEFLVETEIPIISEENKQIGFDERKKWDRCWIVDPLDGTKEFIKRNGEFTVNIALIKNNKPILGVIYIPVKQKIYFTNISYDKSFQFVLSDINMPVQQIIEMAEEIHPIENVDKMRIVGSRSHLNDETKSFIDGIQTEKTVEVVSSGSSLKFCLVAEGEADQYPRFAPTMEWDTAAGQAICEAVGVSVIDHTSNAPLLYNKEDLLNPWFLVSNNL